MADPWLVLAHEASNSGAPRVLLEVLRAIQAARGANWTCEILIDRGGPLADAFAERGQVHRLSHPWAEGMGMAARCLRRIVDRPWLKPRRLRRHVARWQSRGGRLIYSNTATNGRLLAALPPGVGRVVTHVHELAHALYRFNRPQDLAATLARTHRFIAVSSAVAADLRSLGVEDERVQVVPNFLPTLPALPDVVAARAAVCSRLGIAPGARLIVGCGYVDPLKGTDLFVSLIKSLVAQCSDPIVGIWVGGGTDSSFGRRVMKVACDKTRFVGEVSDPNLFFAASEIVVVSSRVESFSRVALEAGALARPVLAYAAARGPADLLGDERLVSEQTVEAMAAAAAHLLAHPDLARMQGEHLRARIAQEFLAQHWVQRLLVAVGEGDRD